MVDSASSEILFIFGIPSVDSSLPASFHACFCYGCWFAKAISVIRLVFSDALFILLGFAMAVANAL